MAEVEHRNQYKTTYIIQILLFKKPNNIKTFFQLYSFFFFFEKNYIVRVIGNEQYNTNALIIRVMSNYIDLIIMHVFTIIPRNLLLLY
jgi:mRNA-degrading endonuclease HigB of HigAB toxin-antitoxin module